MRILVCSKMSIPAVNRTIPNWEEMRKLGHTVEVCHPSKWPHPSPPEVIIGMGVGVMAESFTALTTFPGVPFAAFNWDVYEWVWKTPRKGEYDYTKYGELLSKAFEIWVPSECTGLRTKQWYGLDNYKVVLSSAPYWDHSNVGDDGYVLCCLREIPDPWWGVFERCCEELQIPYRMTKHEQSYFEYQNAVARCRFLCSPLYELSTGGLSLLEGYRLGKPVLINASQWNGASDYFAGRARYFLPGSEKDFKAQLALMYHHIDVFRMSDQKTWVETHYSDAVMVNNILRRIECRLSLGGPSKPSM